MTSRIRKGLGELKPVAFDLSDLKARLRAVEDAVAALQAAYVKPESKPPHLLVDHGNIHALSLTHNDIAFAQRIAEEAVELERENGKKMDRWSDGTGRVSINEAFDQLAEHGDDDNPYEGPIQTPDPRFLSVTPPPHIAVNELEPSIMYDVLNSPERYELNELGNVVGTRGIDDAPSVAHVSVDIPPHIATELQESSLIMNDLVPVGAHHIDLAPSAFARRPVIQHRPPDAESEMATFADEDTEDARRRQYEALSNAALLEVAQAATAQAAEAESSRTVFYDNVDAETEGEFAYMEQPGIGGYPRDALPSMTLKELQEVARSIHLPLPRPKKKKDLITAIEAHMQADGNVWVESEQTHA
jgi:hypothetical protein